MKSILNLKATSGIYVIQNKITGDSYIGSSCNIKKRCNAHRCNLMNDIHPNQYLQRSWNKYGSDCFRFAIIEECRKELLITREQFYIDTTKPKFNLRLIAESNRGCKLSAETRMKISLSHKKPLSLAQKAAIDQLHKNRIGVPVKGKVKESLKLGPLSRIGKPVSEETRRKISESNKGRLSPTKGKKLTEEQKQKISATKKGKPWTEARIMAQKNKAV